MLAVVAGATAVVGTAIGALLARRGVAYAKTKPKQEERPLGISRLAMFPYGSPEPFSMALMPYCLGLGATLVAGAISLTTLSGPIASRADARGPALVTLAWVVSTTSLKPWTVDCC